MKHRLLCIKIKNIGNRNNLFIQKIASKYLLKGNYKLEGYPLIFLKNPLASELETSDKHNVFLFLQSLFTYWLYGQKQEKNIANQSIYSNNLKQFMEVQLLSMAYTLQRVIPQEVQLCKQLLNGKSVSEEMLSKSFVFKEWITNHKNLELPIAKKKRIFLETEYHQYVSEQYTATYITLDTRRLLYLQQQYGEQKADASDQDVGYRLKTKLDFTNLPRIRQISLILYKKSMENTLDNIFLSQLIEMGEYKVYASNITERLLEYIKHLVLFKTKQSALKEIAAIFTRIKRRLEYKDEISKFHKLNNKEFDIISHTIYTKTKAKDISSSTCIKNIFSFRDKRRLIQKFIKEIETNFLLQTISGVDFIQYAKGEFKEELVNRLSQKRESEFEQTIYETLSQFINHHKLVVEEEILKRWSEEINNSLLKKITKSPHITFEENKLIDDFKIKNKIAHTLEKYERFFMEAQYEIPEEMKIYQTITRKLHDLLTKKPDTISESDIFEIVKTNLINYDKYTNNKIIAELHSFSENFIKTIKEQSLTGQTIMNAQLVEAMVNQLKQTSTKKSIEKEDFVQIRQEFSEYINNLVNDNKIVKQSQEVYNYLKKLALEYKDIFLQEDQVIKNISKQINLDLVDYIKIGKREIQKTYKLNLIQNQSDSKNQIIRYAVKELTQLIVDYSRKKFTTLTEHKDWMEVEHQCSDYLFEAILQCKDLIGAKELYSIIRKSDFYEDYLKNNQTFVKNISVKTAKNINIVRKNSIKQFQVEIKDKLLIKEQKNKKFATTKLINCFETGLNISNDNKLISVPIKEGWNDFKIGLTEALSELIRSGKREIGYREFHQLVNSIITNYKLDAFKDNKLVEDFSFQLSIAFGKYYKEVVKHTVLENSTCMNVSTIQQLEELLLHTSSKKIARILEYDDWSLLKKELFDQLTHLKLNEHNLPNKRMNTKLYTIVSNNQTIFKNKNLLIKEFYQQVKDTFAVILEKQNQQISRKLFVEQALDKNIISLAGKHVNNNVFKELKKEVNELLIFNEEKIETKSINRIIKKVFSKHNINFECKKNVIEVFSNQFRNDVIKLSNEQTNKLNSKQNLILEFIKVQENKKIVDESIKLLGLRIFNKQHFNDWELQVVDKWFSIKKEMTEDIYKLITLKQDLITPMEIYKQLKHSSNYYGSIFIHEKHIMEEISHQIYKSLGTPLKRHILLTQIASKEKVQHTEYMSKILKYILSYSNTNQISEVLTHNNLTLIKREIKKIFNKKPNDNNEIVFLQEVEILLEKLLQSNHQTKYKHNGISIYKNKTSEVLTYNNLTLIKQKIKRILNKKPNDNNEIIFLQEVEILLEKLLQSNHQTKYKHNSSSIYENKTSEVLTHNNWTLIKQDIKRILDKKLNNGNEIVFLQEAEILLEKLLQSNHQTKYKHNGISIYKNESSLLVREQNKQNQINSNLTTNNATDFIPNMNHIVNIIKRIMLSYQNTTKQDFVNVVNWKILKEELSSKLLNCKNKNQVIIKQEEIYKIIKDICIQHIHIICDNSLLIQELSNQISSSLMVSFNHKHMSQVNSILLDMQQNNKIKLLNYAFFQLEQNKAEARINNTMLVAEKNKKWKNFKIKLADHLLDLIFYNNEIINSNTMHKLKQNLLNHGNDNVLNNNLLFNYISYKINAGLSNLYKIHNSTITKFKHSLSDSYSIKNRQIITEFSLKQQRKVVQISLGHNIRQEISYALTELINTSEEISSNIIYDKLKNIVMRKDSSYIPRQLITDNYLHNYSSTISSFLNQQMKWLQINNIDKLNLSHSKLQLIERAINLLENTFLNYGTINNSNKHQERMEKNNQILKIAQRVYPLQVITQVMGEQIQNFIDIDSIPTTRIYDIKELQKLHYTLTKEYKDTKENKMIRSDSSVFKQNIMMLSKIASKQSLWKQITYQFFNRRNQHNILLGKTRNRFINSVFNEQELIKLEKTNTNFIENRMVGKKMKHSYYWNGKQRRIVVFEKETSVHASYENRVDINTQDYVYHSNRGNKKSQVPQQPTILKTQTFPKEQLEKQEHKINSLEEQLADQKQTMEQLLKKKHSTTETTKLNVKQVTTEVLKEMQKQLHIEKLRRGYR